MINLHKKRSNELVIAGSADRLVTDCSTLPGLVDNDTKILVANSEGQDSTHSRSLIMTCTLWYNKIKSVPENLVLGA